MNLLKNKKKRKLPKKKILFFSFIAVVVIVLVTGFVMLLTRGRELSDTMLELPVSLSSSSDTAAATTPQARPYFAAGPYIVYTQGDLLTCLDARLNTVWQLRLFSAGLEYTSDNDIIAATGYGVIQVIDTKGQHLFSTQLDGEISSARIGKDKVAVYVYQTVDETTKQYIVVFDLNGESLYQIDVTDRYVLRYGFDADSSLLYVLELDVSGSTPISRILTYRPETQSVTGRIELKNQIVSSLYISGDQMYAIGTNQMTMFASQSAESASIMIYGWALNDICCLPDPRFVFIPANSEKEINIVRIIRGSGNELTINLPPGVFDIVHTSDKIYCFANDKIFVYTVEGKYLRMYTLPFEISSVERAIEKHVFVTQGNKAYLLPLP